MICPRDSIVLKTNSVESKSWLLYWEPFPNALALDLSMNWTVLASLMDRFSRWWPRAGTVAFLLDVSGALDTADREVLGLAGVKSFIFYHLHPDFMEGHMRWNWVITYLLWKLTCMDWPDFGPLVPLCAWGAWRWTWGLWDASRLGATQPQLFPLSDVRLAEQHTSS